MCYLLVNSIDKQNSVSAKPRKKSFELLSIYLDVCVFPYSWINNYFFYWSKFVLKWLIESWLELHG